MPISLSSLTITPVTGVDFVASASPVEVYRTSQDAFWTYELISCKNNDNPDLMKDPWHVAAMPWPPQPDAGSSHVVSAYYVQQGHSHTYNTKFTYNTTGSVNIHNPQTYSYSSFTGALGLGVCGIIYSDGPGVAQKPWAAGDTVSSVSVDWGQGRIFGFANDMLVNGTDGGTYATQTVENFIRASNGSFHYWEDGGPWRTGYPQAFNFNASTNSCGETIWGVLREEVPANPLWRDDLVQ
jgi:hypothetical protein